MRKITLTILVVFVLGVCPVQADTVWTSGHHIITDANDPFGEIWMYNDATLDILGGEIGRLAAYDVTVTDWFGGQMGTLWARDNSIVNIYGGTLGDLAAAENSLINLYAYDVILDTTEYILIGKYYSDDTSFAIYVYNQEVYSHINIIPVIYAKIEIKPNTLNLSSKGKWLTCHIWLPEDYNVADIEPHSVVIENEPNDIHADWLWFNEKQNVAMAKFSRSNVDAILEAGEIELRISGRLTNGTIFEGTDTIRVIDKGGPIRVNSNSKVEDGIEYYIQTDKVVYNLGENIEILYRITNLTDEEWRLVGFFPIMDLIVEAREGKNFNEIWHWSWDKFHHGGPIVFRLEPGESVELNGIWPQIDLNGSVEPEDHTHVPPGRYRISGVFYPTDSSIAVDITIVKGKS